MTAGPAGQLLCFNTASSHAGTRQQLPACLPQVLIHHVKRMVLYVPARVLYAPVLIYEMTSTPYIPAQARPHDRCTVCRLRREGPASTARVAVAGC